jgi:hypothetical protein
MLFGKSKKPFYTIIDNTGTDEARKVLERASAVKDKFLALTAFIDNEAKTVTFDICLAPEADGVDGAVLFVESGLTISLYEELIKKHMYDFCKFKRLKVRWICNQ